MSFVEPSGTSDDRPSDGVSSAGDVSLPDDVSSLDDVSCRPAGSDRGSFTSISDASAVDGVFSSIVNPFVSSGTTSQPVI